MTKSDLFEQSIDSLSNYNVNLNRLYSIYDSILRSKPYEDPTKVIDDLITNESNLQQHLRKIEEHQAIYSRIMLLKEEIATQGQRPVELVKLLTQSKQSLKILVEQGQEIVNLTMGIDYLTVGQVNSEDLLHYAQRVAKHTLGPMEPPIPQEHHMRMSTLFDQKKDVVIKEDQTQEEQSDIIHIEMPGTVISNRPPSPTGKEEEELLDLDLF